MKDVVEGSIDTAEFKNPFVVAICMVTPSILKSGMKVRRPAGRCSLFLFARRLLVPWAWIA